MKKILFYVLAAGMFLHPGLVGAVENDEGWGTLVLRDTKGASGNQSWKQEGDLFKQRGNIDVKMQRIIMPLGIVLPQTNVEVKIGGSVDFPDYGYYLDVSGTNVHNIWGTNFTYNPSIFNNDKNGTKDQLTSYTYNGVTVKFHHTEISKDGGSTWEKVRTTKSKESADADIYCCHATYDHANFYDITQSKYDYGWTFFNEDNDPIILSSNTVDQAKVVLAADFRVRLVYDYPVPSALWIADHADAGNDYIFLAVRPPLPQGVTLTSDIAAGLAPYFKAVCATRDMDLDSVGQSDWKSATLRDPTGELDVDKGLIWLKVPCAAADFDVDKNQLVWRIVFTPPPLTRNRAICPGMQSVLPQESSAGSECHERSDRHTYSGHSALYAITFTLAVCPLIFDSDSCIMCGVVEQGRLGARAQRRKEHEDGQISRSQGGFDLQEGLWRAQASRQEPSQRPAAP